MYRYDTYEMPFKGSDIIEPLVANTELDDFIWLLDQCGFDEHVRAMPYKDIFLSMHQKLLGKIDDLKSGIEDDILRNFTYLGNSRFVQYSGHRVAQHLLNSLWYNFHGHYNKINLLEYKIQQIAHGSAPTHPIKNMELPEAVTAEGSRIALLLMLKVPQGFKVDFVEWAEKQALFEHLNGIKPNHPFVKQQLEETTARFKPLYRNANRRRNTAQRYSQKNSDNLANFYKNLHKYSYSKKCSIIRCLLETDLTQ